MTGITLRPEIPSLTLLHNIDSSDHEISTPVQLKKHILDQLGGKVVSSKPVGYIRSGTKFSISSDSDICSLFRREATVLCFGVMVYRSLQVKVKVTMIHRLKERKGSAARDHVYVIGLKNW